MPQESVLSPDELARIDEIYSKIDEIYNKLEKGKISNYEALREIHDIVENNIDLLRKDKEAFNSIVEIEYSLGYNSLLDGVSPGQVRPHMLKESWQKLTGDLPGLARVLIEEAIASGDLEKARRIYDEYKDYLLDKDREDLGILVSEEFQGLVSAINNGDYDKLRAVLEKAEAEGKYNEYKKVFKEYYGEDLDEVRRVAYSDYIYSILEGAKTPEEALDKLRQARRIAEEAGLEGLVSDLEHSVNAIEKAGKGDLEGFIKEASKISDRNILKYTLGRGLFELERNHPDVLAETSKEEVERLKELVKRSGLNANIDDVIALAKGYEIAVKLNDLLNKGDVEDALKLWKSLNEEYKEAVSLLLGEPADKIQETLEVLKYVKESAEKADRLARLVDKGDYIEAYQYWESLPPKDRNTVASILGVDPGELGETLALWAGLQAVSKLENPTLAQVEKTLAEYLGEEKARRITSQLLEETPLYKAKTLADQGKYDEALRIILESPLDPEEKKLGVEYILASISEYKGAEALADFVSRHEKELEPYLSKDMARAVELVGQAGVIAGDLASIIEETASQEYGERLASIIQEYKRLLENRDWRRAEELLEENRNLLREARINEASLLDLLLELYTIARAGDILDKASSRLEDLSQRIQEDPETVAREADRIAKQAEAYLDSVSKLQHVEESIKRQYEEALRRLGAYAYAVEAQALVASGKLDQAVRVAEEASKLDPEFNQLYQTVKIISLALRDEENLAENIECIAENILKIKPRARRGGGKPKHILFT